MAEHYAPLFQPLRLGAIEVPNRVFMAPLTRNRAHPDGTPHEMAITYYRQRAGAGLIFTEATQTSQQGQGYINTPSIETEAQAEAWQRIVDAVHEAGGRIYIQLFHVGRVSHKDLQPGGHAPVAPSAIQADTKAFTEQGQQPASKPRPLEIDEIKGVVKQFARCAAHAKQVGFDGVEVHGASGYLIDQFLRDGSNERADAYGGTVDKRIRFLREVVEAVAKEIGADRTGLRLSPLGQFNDMHDSDPAVLFARAYDAMAEYNLAYLHVVEQFPGEELSKGAAHLIAQLRGRWPGRYIANGGFGAEDGAERVKAGDTDALTYGRSFIANPDLPARFRLDAALNEPDQSTFYGGDERGYIDYPFLGAGDKAA